MSKAMDDFIEELKELCEKHNAVISTCRCCGLTFATDDDVTQEYFNEFGNIGKFST